MTMTILDSSTQQQRQRSVCLRSPVRPVVAQRQTGDVELVGGPLRETEAIGMLQGLPDRRDTVAQVAEVEGRDERRELRQRPQPDGNQAEIDETATPEPLVTPAHDYRPRQAFAVHNAGHQCADYRAQGVGEQVTQGSDARGQELL
jgi:hypothetical protein